MCGALFGLRVALLIYPAATSARAWRTRRARGQHRVRTGQMLPSDAQAAASFCLSSAMATPRTWVTFGVLLCLGTCAAANLDAPSCGDRRVNVAVAIMLLGTVTFQLCMFYLVNHPDEDMKRYSWEVCRWLWIRGSSRLASVLTWILDRELALHVA